MLKRDELSVPDSCFNRAADDEMVFVLLERDVAAPHAIREWALERVLRGKNHADDEQIVEALKLAENIEAKQDCAEVERNCFSQNKTIRATFPSLHNLLTDPLDRLDRLEQHAEPFTSAHRAELRTSVIESATALQRETINTLADCLVREAERLERTNGFVKLEDLKREAQALRDYAETLAPPAPEANR